MNDDYLKEVFKRLSMKPQDPDFLIAAYSKIGYMLAELDAVADDAVIVRKNTEAEAWLRARETMPATVAEKVAHVEVFALRRAEGVAEAKAAKVRALHESVYQAIQLYRAGSIDLG